MATRNPPWTRDELILALDMYFKQRPSHISARDAGVVALSNDLNRLPVHTERPDEMRFRNPNGVYMKLCNFLRLDPSYTGSGLTHGGKLENEVWETFANDRPRLHQVSTAIRAALQSPTDPGLTYAAMDDEYEAPEGRILERLHSYRERNAGLVRKKKRIVLQRTGTLTCEACAFVFSAVYGALGEGFIECHHTIPLSNLRPGQVTRLKDLALVCSNCHRMMHRRAGTVSVAELREKIQIVPPNRI